MLLAIGQAASAAESAGSLDQRALVFHEAWFEAHLSLDAAGVEREWRRLVAALKTSLRHRALVSVSGDGAQWRIELTPPRGRVKVLLDPDGVRLVSPKETPEPPRTLIDVYPLRRHYDCSGRPLNAGKPGVPVRGVPCAPPTQAQWVHVARATEGGALVSAMKDLPCCDLVLGDDRGVLKRGQILAEMPDQRYETAPADGDKSRVGYARNHRLLVMEKKQPKLFVLEP